MKGGTSSPITPRFEPSLAIQTRVCTTRAPVARQVLINPLIFASRDGPSGEARGDPSTKQTCMSTLISAVVAGNSGKSGIRASECLDAVTLHRYSVTVLTWARPSRLRAPVVPDDP